MPLPIPASGESQQNFVSRCVSILVGEGREQDQAAAICYDRWKRSRKGYAASPPLSQSSPTATSNASND